MYVLAAFLVGVPPHSSFLTLQEEVTLRKGVQRFGVGNWKAILAAYPAVFKVRYLFACYDS